VSSTFLGESSEHTVDVAGHAVKVLASPPRMLPAGPVVVEFSPDAAVSLPA
jgi:hypothetical protein